MPPTRTRAAALLLLAAVLAGSVSAQERPAPEGGPVSGEALPVVADTLENGLRLFVLPRSTSPTVSFVVSYRVGSVDEHLGNTGIAHLLEHMLFKGTTTVGTRDVEAERALFPRIDSLAARLADARAGSARLDSARIRTLRDSIRALEDSARTFVVPNEFDEILSRNGARSLNATTTEESTTYFVELPANRAKLWFVLEADRMANPVFRGFYAERDVVAEERRSRVETRPGGLVHEAHMATAYRVHPYGVPVVGHMFDIQNLTRGQAREYYDRFYGARNAVVAVVGDVEADSIRTWAERYLGRVRPGDTPPPVLATEPEQSGERRTEVVFDAEPRLKVGWHVVDVFHPDRPALVVLTSILTGGRTSRLHRRLILEDRIATSVTSSVGPGDLDPGHFSINAVPRAPHETGEVERAIYEELDRLREQPPDSLELARVRNQLEASRVRRLRSNFGLAFQIARSATLYGDWQTTFRYTGRLQAVTPADVQRVVRRYFTPENRTVTTLVPEEGGR